MLKSKFKKSNREYRPRKDNRRLTTEQVIDIRSSTETLKILALRYKISTVSIWYIRRRLVYCDID